MIGAAVTARVIDGSALTALAKGSRYVAALVAVARHDDHRLRLVTPCSALIEAVPGGLDGRLLDPLITAAGVVFTPLDIEAAQQIAGLFARAPGGLELDVLAADAAAQAINAGIPVLTAEPQRYGPLKDRLAIDRVP